MLRFAALGFALWPGVAALEFESPLNGLKIEIKKQVNRHTGCKLKSTEKDFLEMHYVTRIAESSKTGKPGMQIDTSRDDDGMNDPLSVQLGTGRLINGWDQGVRDMCEGEIRVLTIEPEHAYGENGHQTKNADGEEINIPPGASLIIEAELIRIVRLGREIKSLQKPGKCKRKAAAGDMVKVHYTLWIHESSMAGEKGSMVESSHDSQPMEFQLGAGRVIPGWDQGLEGACTGERLELVVPPEFGYGEKGQGENVPPMATLHFEVQVLEVTETNLFQQIDTSKDGKINIEELGAFLEKAQGEKDPEVVKSIFENEDKDKDGFIDWEEAPFPKGEKPATLTVTKGEKPATSKESKSEL